MAKKAATKKTIKKVRKSKVVKEWNDNTMTSAAFFGMIRSALRNKSRFWKPIMKVKNAAKVSYKGPNKRRKFSYICGECKQEFDSKQVKVHHIEECGSLNSFEDIGEFCRRLFCTEDKLILLCDSCHDKKHH